MTGHFPVYGHEALVMPALCTLGSQALTALVLGGSDGGVATQLLKSPDLQKVVLVAAEDGLEQVSQKHFHHMSAGFEDPRLVWVAKSPEEFLTEDPSAQETYDIVIVLNAVWHGLKTPSPDFRPAGSIAELRQLLAPGGVFVHQGDFEWNLPRMENLFSEVRATFKDVFVGTFSSIDNMPWHEVAFFAGRDFLEPNFDWCRARNFTNIYYNEAMHGAMFVPAVTTSRKLGLEVPRRPDRRAAQRVDVTAKDTSKAGENSRGLGARSWKPPFKLKNEQPRGELVYKEKTKFQHLKVYKNDGYTTLYLDDELQLTSLFGDFYHEALVHPAMAALGPRGKTVLIIGAGDGGVATTVLKYPHVQVAVQIEIDESVVNVSKAHLPDISKGFQDTRMKLRIQDALLWVRSSAKSARKSGRGGIFDLVIIDTTDDPLVSPWTPSFYKDLNFLLARHGAMVQNIGSQGEWVDIAFFRGLYAKTHGIYVNTPDYPSPYFLSLSTDDLDVFNVDWDFWSGLEISTIYYHPTLHDTLFVLPQETQSSFDGRRWTPLPQQLPPRRRTEL